MGPPQFNTSVPHRWATPFQPPKSLSSTPKTPQFNTTPSVPHQKPLSSTHSPQFHTKNPSVPHKKALYKRTEGFFDVELRGSVELRGCVELMGFTCGTEGFWGLKRSGPFVWN